MATKKLTICDVDGCEREGDRFVFSRGRRMDAAGGSESVDRIVDLCPAHVSVLMGMALNNLDYTGQDELFDIIKVKRMHDYA